MFLRHAAHLEAFPFQHRAYGLLDLGTLGQHHLAILRADVVDIRVHGQAREIEEKKIQRRAALEGNASFQDWMTLDALEEPQQMDRLLHHVGAESCGRRFGEQFLPGDLHDGSSQDRSRISTGTTKFQSAAKRPGFRVLRSR